MLTPKELEKYIDLSEKLISSIKKDPYSVIQYFDFGPIDTSSKGYQEMMEVCVACYVEGIKELLTAIVVWNYEDANLFIEQVPALLEGFGYVPTDTPPEGEMN